MDSFVDELRGTLGLAAPLAGAQLLGMSMVVVDNLVVGHLGPAPLAAMAMAATLYNFCFIVCIGILSAVGPMVSNAVATGQTKAVGHIIRQAWLLSALWAGLMILVCWRAEYILPHLGQQADLIPLAAQFLRSACWGIPAATGYLALRQLSEGNSDTRPSMAISAGVALLNPFLDLGLVLGWFGCPRLAMPGAGVALSIANWTMFVLLASYLHFAPRYRHFMRGGGGSGAALRDILRIGLPMGGSLLFEMSFFGVVTMAMGTLGAVQLAAHQIAVNICSFAFMVPLGVSLAAGIRVGHAVGRQDQPAVVRAGQAALTLVLVTQGTSGACFLLFAEPLVRLYTPDPAVTGLAVTLLRMGGLFQLFDGLQVVGMGILRGLQDTRVPFLSAFVSFWVVGVPLGLFLTFRRDWGPVGLWTGLVVGLGTAAALHYWRFRVLTRRSV